MVSHVLLPIGFAIVIAACAITTLLLNAALWFKIIQLARADNDFLRGEKMFERGQMWARLRRRAWLRIRRRRRNQTDSETSDNSK